MAEAVALKTIFCLLPVPWTVAVTPFGRVERVSFTLPLKPLESVMVIASLAVEFSFRKRLSVREREAAAADSVIHGGGVLRGEAVTDEVVVEPHESADDPALLCQPLMMV